MATRRHPAKGSAIVRIRAPMIRDFGDCVQAGSATAATSSGSILPDGSTAFLVRPLPMANSVLTPPGNPFPSVVKVAEWRATRYSQCA